MTEIRLALAQIDVEPNRPDINVGRIIETIDRQRERGSELVVFSRWSCPRSVREFADCSSSLPQLAVARQ